MLQQTYVSRVLEKFPQFLRRFPTMRALAAATQKDVVIAWQGMGYNNRAVRLHRLAKTVVHQHGGKLPRNFQDLIQLPGVGRYTANAVLSSAFGKDAPVVDVNVRRFFSRVFWKMDATTDMRPLDDIWNMAEQLAPAGKAYQWNQAVMDLGATVCIARDPRCDVCPVGSYCRSKSAMKRAAPTSSAQSGAKGVIPNRIYRGRIIEALRHHHGRRRLQADALGKAIHPRYSRKHRKWLDELLMSLERDGLIMRSKQRVSLA